MAAFGRTLLQDLYSSTPLATTFISPAGSQAGAPDIPLSDGSQSNILAQAPSAQEIERYFSLITPLKYSQPHQPTASQGSPPLEGLILTAYNSGHTVGGTIWHIQHGMESVVYAVDWNQVRENVIGGAAWFGGIGGSEVIEQLRKPTALICSSRGGLEVAIGGGRKKRDDLLVDNIRSRISKGGDVLIPTESSTRMLELAWVLERAWQEDPTLRTARVYLASRAGSATLRHARSLLEWMDDSIFREFEGEDEAANKMHQRIGTKQTSGPQAKPARPFEFRHVNIVERRSQFERLSRGDGVKVFIASDISLEWGFARDSFQELAQKPENLIILTGKSFGGASSVETVGQRLWSWFEEKRDGVALEKASDGEQIAQVHTGGRTLSLRNAQRTRLDPSETELYQQYAATQQQMQKSMLSDNEPNAAKLEDAADHEESSSSSSDDSDDEYQGRALNVSAALGHAARRKVALSDEDLGVHILLRRRDVYDYDVRNKKGRNAIFPYLHGRKRADEFGEYIRPEDYLRAEEKVEQDPPIDLQNDRKLGQKRKRQESKRGPDGPGRKRQQTRRGQHVNEASQNGRGGTHEHDEIDESDESEEEIEADPVQDPAKIVMTSRAINVNARLAFVDFAGLHDQRSLQMLIPLISPRKLVLTAGTARETEALASDCRALLSVKDGGAASASVVEIFTPGLNNTVDASVDTNAWIVKLSRNLMQRLHWQNVRNMAVATLMGQLHGEEPSQAQPGVPVRTKKPRLLDEQPEQNAGQEAETSMRSTKPKDVDPVLDIVPASMAVSTRSAAQPLHVGDMRLADLRRLMNSAGHSAEFRGEGILLIDSAIAVRKLGTGRIVVEGSTANSIAVTSNAEDDNFQRVKQHIYQGLAVVAGR